MMSWIFAFASILFGLAILAICLWVLARFKLSRSLHMAELRLQLLEDQIRRLEQENQP